MEKKEIPVALKGLQITDLLPTNLGDQMSLGDFGDAVKNGAIERVISYRIMEDTLPQIAPHFAEAVGAGYHPNRIAKIAIDQLSSHGQDDIHLTIAWLTQCLEGGASLPEIIATTQSELKGIDRSDVLFAVQEWAASHPSNEQ